MLLQRLSSKRDVDDDGDGDVTNHQYHEIVDEIKAEGKCLGSLQLHSEAMKRLKERRCSGDHSAADRRKSEPRPRGFARSMRPVNDFARSLRVDNLAKSIVMMNRRTSSGHNSADSPGEAVMPGRRTSAMAVGIDQDIIAAQVLQDLELSDSEDEDDDAGMTPQQYLAQQGSESGGSSRGGRRRRSIIRRTSSLLGRPLTRRMSRRSSNVSSVSSCTNSTPNSVDGAEKQTAKPAEKSNGEGWEGLSDSETSKDEPRLPSEINDLLESTNGQEKEEAPAQEPPAGAQRKFRARRTGRRRSSLFSVDERRASVNLGTNSIDSASLGRRASMDSLGESLQGSFSGNGNGNNSLICSFGHKDSFRSSLGSGDAGGDALICDWQRRQSMLSESGASIQEDMLREAEGKIARDAPQSSNGNHNESLICGWDPQQSAVSQMSIPEDELTRQIEERKSASPPSPGSNISEHSNRSLLCDWGNQSKLSSSSASLDLIHVPGQGMLKGQEDEEALLRAKESCTLFDVRNAEGRGSAIC